MLEVTQRIESIVGVPIGQVGEPISPFRDAIKDKGLPVPGNPWVWRVRTGKRQGKFQLGQLERALVTQNSDSSRKDKFYRRMATEAVSLRTFGSGAYSNRYTSEGFVPELAGNLQIDSKDASRAIRAMRADVVYGYQEDPALEQLFHRVVESYFEGNISGLYPSLRNEGAIRLNESWDRASIPSFYRALYQMLKESSGRTIGGFTPYEIEFMQKFYEKRTRSRVAVSPTEFDKEAITVGGNNESKMLAKKISEETGIPVNFNVIYIHRNALVFGTTRAEFLRRKQ